MLHKTLAPDFPIGYGQKAGGGPASFGRIHLTISTIKACQKRQFGEPKDELFDLIKIEQHGNPTLVIDRQGHGRFVRRKERQDSYGIAHVYLNAKVYHCATPFDQPMHVLVSVYEKALKDYNNGNGKLLPIPENDQKTQ